VIVVDTNVLVQFVVQGTRSALVLEVRRRDSEWVAPSLWRSEMHSVLSGHLRRGALSLGEAVLVLRNASLALRHRDERPSSARVLSLVATSRCSAYDCEFVALARQHRVRLVTFDQQVLNEFPETALAPEAFAAGS
jgi:predicted nucleic acid-binding protein